MKDFIRESLSYGGLYRRMLLVKREYEPQFVSYGNDSHQYFLYYEPKREGYK